MSMQHAHAVSVTIFSTDGRFCLVSNFTELHTCSYSSCPFLCTLGRTEYVCSLIPISPPRFTLGTCGMKTGNETHTLALNPAWIWKCYRYSQITSCSRKTCAPSDILYNTTVRAHVDPLECQHTCCFQSPPNWLPTSPSPSPIANSHAQGSHTSPLE